MSMQNWNMSEYVTIIHCPPFFLSEGAKRRFPSAKRVGEMLALEIVDTWLNTAFSHAERHQRRIDKVMALENE